MKRITFILLAMLQVIALSAQSDLLITPYRVVFEDGKTIQEVSLANTGVDTSRYSINFVQYQMKEDGSLNQITDPEPNQYFADRFIRVFPRSVILAPQEAQIVRLQLRMPSNAEQVEYRSHLYFRSTPNDDAEGIEMAADTSLGIKLIPVYGITIPVIVRIGDLTVTTGIKDVEFIRKESPEIKFVITREGSKSIFGDLTVHFTDAAGISTVIGSARGVAVYTPIASRQMTIPLNFNTDTVTPKGTIRITYISAGGSKKETFFEHSFAIE